ncbi:TIGR00659 family protein [Enhydrobacter aerosaccus]|uniref:TIGR00659 family protein n=1 Tax=Enhydrobacter aerosaccus TaxID=225324 RepID=A0A1T4TB92_9HYPH|nr:LrgB family protein [Enhydrobacter aerosaccus]SKA37667.1 TIGR00659 family protein [Enhydrobacter aerosaccus]
MSEPFYKLWVYLAAGPLVWLTATLIAYQIGRYLQARTRGNPAANPVLIAVILLVLLLARTDVPYAQYFAGAQFVHFLLGTATVALGLPLWREAAMLRRHIGPLLLSIAGGSVTAAGTAVVVAWALGASRATLLSLAPKSVTTPIAMGITEKLGGIPSLTAVLVILTGVLGAIIATWVLDTAGIRDWRARGLAAGTVAHGIGTARAYQVNPTAGAYAGLAMGVNGLLTAIVLPYAARWL